MAGNLIEADRTYLFLTNTLVDLVHKITFDVLISNHSTNSCKCLSNLFWRQSLDKITCCNHDFVRLRICVHHREKIYKF